MSLGEGGVGDVAMLWPASRALADGVRLGLLVALGAVGLALIVATTRLVNFAHAALVAAGGYVAFFLNTGALGPRLHLVPAAGVAVGCVALLGLGLERGLWRPLRTRNAGVLRVHLIAIALAVLLDNVLGFAYFFLVPGGTLRPFEHYAIQRPMYLGPVTVTPRDLSLTALCLLALFTVAAFVRWTRTGAGIRAVAEDAALASASGADPDRIRLVAWALAGGLAALCGVFFGVSHDVASTSRLSLIVLMFAAVVIGGTSTVAGPVLGSLAVGVTTELSALWIPHELKVAPVLLVMAVALWRRTEGSTQVREAFG